MYKMIYALIKNGICINTIVCEPDVIRTIDFGVDAVIPITAGGIGDIYNSIEKKLKRPNNNEAIE